MKENKSIDQIAKDALEHYEMPYEPMHWDALESRLTAAQTPRRASVVAIKAIELLLMTVTLFTLLHYANHNSTDFVQPNTILPFGKTEVNAVSSGLTTNVKAVANTQAVNEIESHSENLNTNENAKGAKTTRIYTSASAHTIFAKAKQNGNALPNIPLLHTYNSTNSTITNNAENTVNTLVHTQNTPTKANTAAEALPDDEHIVIEAAPSVVHSNVNTNTVNTSSNINTGATNTGLNTNPQNPQNGFAPNSPNSSNSFLIEQLPTQPLQNLPLPANDLQISIVKSMPIAANYDTPYETVSMLRRRPVLKGSAGYEFNTISQFSRNSVANIPTKSQRFGLGIMVNVFKKLNVETALEVTHKNYQTPNEVTNFASSSTNQVIQSTAMLLAEVPISANINIIETPKLNVYVKAGARFSNLLTAQYIWRNGTDAVYSTYDASLTTNSRLSSGQYEEITNATSFWSLGGGVGISYHVSPRVSLFAEPSLYRALSGIGQRKDYINSMGIGLGASCVL